MARPHFQQGSVGNWCVMVTCTMIVVNRNKKNKSPKLNYAVFQISTNHKNSIIIINLSKRKNIQASGCDLIGRGEAEHRYHQRCDQRCHLVRPAAPETVQWAADDAADKPASRVLLTAPPAVNALMTNKNKDSVSHGAAGSLLQTGAQWHDTHTRVQASLVVHLSLSKHTLKLARSGPQGLNTPEFIAACWSRKQKPSATVLLWRRADAFTRVGAYKCMCAC